MIVVLAFLVQAGSGYLQGRRLFATLGILMVVEAAIKVGLGSLLAVAVGPTGALIGAAAGIGVVAAVSLRLARRDIGRSGLPLRAYPWRQISGVGAVQAGVSALAMLDVIVGSLLLGASRAMAGYQAMLVFARSPVVSSPGRSAPRCTPAWPPTRAARRETVWFAMPPPPTGRWSRRSSPAPAPFPPPSCSCSCPTSTAAASTCSSRSLLPGRPPGWLNLLTTCYQAESAFSWPVVLLWGSIPIAAELEVRFSGSVTGLAWTAAAVDSAVALILVGAACRRYRGPACPGPPSGRWRSLRSPSPSSGPVSRLPWLWCALAIPVADGFVDGRPVP